MKIFKYMKIKNNIDVNLISYLKLTSAKNGKISIDYLNWKRESLFPPI